MRTSTSDRRQFLLGAAATSLLVACGSSSDPSGGDPDAGPTANESDLSVVRFFGPYFPPGAPARVPFGIADADGALPADAVPGTVVLSVRSPDGEVVAADLTATRHDEGLPRPYYAFEFTPEVTGFHDFTVDVDGAELVSQLQVVGPDAPGMAGFVGPGDPLPPLVTPTVDDPQGVTPVCTRDPMCELHQHTVADLVGTAPLALLVATPAFCQTAVCGPILDVLLGVVPDFPEVEFVHAEVYRNPAENEVPPVASDFAPVVGELGLPFEPVLHLADSSGTVVERLDYIFDASEMREVLSDLR